MGVRDGDPRHAAEFPNSRNRRIIHKADAIPQDVAAARTYQQSALANGELGFADDAPESRIFLEDPVAKLVLEILEGNPLLDRKSTRLNSSH